MTKFAKIFIVLVTLIAAGYFGWQFFGPKDHDMPMVITHGEADIGGPFALAGTDGELVTDQVLLGRYALVYFGYTSCPDVCPLDMNRISIALGILEKEMDFSAKLQPVFISVDAGRDTPEQVALFLEQYHSSFLGLTGTAEQIDAAAKAYKVYYEHMLAREHGGDGLINHTAYIYLMDPEGKFVTTYDSSVTAPALAADLAERLD